MVRCRGRLGTANLRAESLITIESRWVCNSGLQASTMALGACCLLRHTGQRPNLPSHVLCKFSAASTSDQGLRQGDHSTFDPLVEAGGMAKEKHRKKEKRRDGKHKRKKRRRSSSRSSGGSGGGRHRAPSPRRLLLAAALGDKQQCRELVQDGADVAYADAEGTTALHEVGVLCAGGRGWSVALGLSLLAQFNLCECRLMPAVHPFPLHQACRHGHLSTAKLLLRRGADAGLGDVRGDTPAHLAARHGHLDVLAALLQAGGEEAVQI